MKKILLSVLTLALSVNLFAINYSGKVTVAIFDGSHIHNATIAGSSDVPEGQLLNGYYTPVQDLNSLSVAAYVPFNNVAYESIVLHSLTNTPLVIKASTVSNYSLYFTNLEDPISLYDTKVGQFVDMTTNPYNFTIEDSERDANNIVANRFIINYVPAPVAVASVTTNDYGWATFSYSQNLVPVNATAQTLYKGIINGSYLDLTEVNYVPNDQGVLVKGEANTTYYFAAGTATSDFSFNALLATATYSYPMENVYVLKGNAFQPYEGTNALAANKAYIKLSANNAPARISFRFNGAQAIENAEMEDAKAVKFVENGQVFIRRGEAVYNMQGQIVK